MKNGPLPALSRIVFSVFYRTLSAVAATGRSNSSRSSSPSTTAAAGAIYSSSNTHLPCAVYLAAANRVSTGMYHAPNGPCSLDWYAVSAEILKERENNHIQCFTSIILPRKRLSTDTRRFVGFDGHGDSCLEPCTPGQRATWATCPGLRGAGAADFRRDLADIGRERVTGDGAPGG